MSGVPSNNASGPPGAIDSSVGGFTNEQIQTMAKDLVSSGRLSEAQVAAMYTQGLVDSGAATPAQAGALDSVIDRVNDASSISPLQPTVRKHLEALGMNPARDIAEYVFPMEGDGFLTPQAAQAELLGRTWLMAGGFSAKTGSMVVDEIVRAGKAFEGMSEIDREIWLQQQEQLVRRTLGEFGQNANERIELAKRLVSEIDKQHPGLKRFLDETGVGSSAVVVAAFVAQAEALARRQA